jgi:hypothetical protein
VPRALAARAPHVDVAAAMEEKPGSRAVTLKMLNAPDAPSTLGHDPFAGVEV